MNPILKLIKSPIGLSGMLMALSVNASAADHSLVKDLQPGAQASVVSYLKDDPECHSCRGNARSAGVSYLEHVQDTTNGQEYLRGKVWANSCQDWGNGIHAYGDTDASLGNC